MNVIEANTVTATIDLLQQIHRFICSATGSHGFPPVPDLTMNTHRYGERPALLSQVHAVVAGREFTQAPVRKTGFERPKKEGERSLEP